MQSFSFWNARWSLYPRDSTMDLLDKSARDRLVQIEEGRIDRAAEVIAHLPFLDALPVNVSEASLADAARSILCAALSLDGGDQI
jgi:hypothetical protein